ncbi:hypothetical protein CDV36_008780 [Fusarium kuroshium]|uniref:Uncharacterized protein n=1 Tax=Fusarium kuroshium TaxID=2010991 RepID=A0A3M2S200_9HYPO|nr:hypothetical protein CDV36_008780 [Fusarium kuroshium]
MLAPPPSLHLRPRAAHFANQGTLAPAGDLISLSIQWRPGRLEPCGAPLSLPPARAAAGRVLGAGEEDLGWRIGCSNEALRSSLFSVDLWSPPDSFFFSSPVAEWLGLD